MPSRCSAGRRYGSTTRNEKDAARLSLPFLPSHWIAQGERWSKPDNDNDNNSNNNNELEAHEYPFLRLTSGTNQSQKVPQAGKSQSVAQSPPPPPLTVTLPPLFLITPTPLVHKQLNHPPPLFPPSPLLSGASCQHPTVPGGFFSCRCLFGLKGHLFFF